MSDINQAEPNFFTIMLLQLCTTEKKELIDGFLLGFLTLLSQKSDRINSANFCGIVHTSANAIKLLHQNFGNWIFSLSEQVSMVLISLFFEFDTSTDALFTKANCENYKLNYNSKIIFKFRELNLSLSSSTSIK